MNEWNEICKQNEIECSKPKQNMVGKTKYLWDGINAIAFGVGDGCDDSEPVDASDVNLVDLSYSFLAQIICKKCQVKHSSL